MAKKQIETKTKDIEHVTCDGCMFIEPYEDFKGHGFCAEIHVRMITVIETPKQCVWKRENGRK